MKVLSVTNMYPTESRPYYGIFVKEFHDAMRDTGVDVAVSVTDATQSRKAYFREVPRIRKQLAREQHDIIHAHHTYSVCQVKAAQFLSRNKTPVVFTIHEGEALMPEGTRDEQADWLKRLVYLRRPKQWALNAVDRVVSVNEHIPKALGFQKAYDIIPPGVDLRLFTPHDKGECRKRLGIGEGEVVVLFPADPNNPFKGYDVVQKGVDRLSLKARVITGGGISHEEMPYYMCAADVVVQASSFEASPMVAKETMAVNVPMVSTEVGDVKAVVGSTPGYFVCKRDPDDVAAKIKEALDFEGRILGRERLLSLGLSLEQVARKYLRIYEEILERSEPS